ncbi:hypothetical protein QJS04_geneDACA020772 [Acorus gramineus]|uniref:Kinetochore protein Nuf2 N-terminal domain-containing protein n=1 Tax=Acorus gramineus TaxID=55184 RepID=A0AAV9A6Q3_ACOGR|nr:hypothetical protein QJS04_geneDACA020772 [Acorus gramineus]
MSTYAFPILTHAEAARSLSQLQISTVKPEDLARPTPDLVCSLYRDIVVHLDNSRAEWEHQVDFNALEGVENPESHWPAIQVLNLFSRVRWLVSSPTERIVPPFSMRDLIRPDPKRTAVFISALVNFCHFRMDKLELFRPIFDKMQSDAERQEETEAKIAELNKQLLDLEESKKMEEPVVQQLEAEVRELKHTIHTLNNQQMSLQASFKALKGKSVELDNKISQVEFTLSETAKEKSELQAKIVQSPEKLQRTFEEKKLHRDEVQNLEREAKHKFQEKNAVIKVYSKAVKKISKHLEQMQVLQEQVTRAKAIDKDFRALKAKISNEEMSDMTLEAKLSERKGKLEQLEELVKATQKERNLKLAEATRELDSVKVEVKAQLRELELRERRIEAMVAKTNVTESQIKSIQESAANAHQQLRARYEELVNEFYSYSNSIREILESEGL